MFVREESDSGKGLDFSSGDAADKELRDELRWWMAMSTWWRVERQESARKRILKI